MVAPASSVGAVIAAILPVSDSAPGRGREVCRRGSIHESAEKRGWECAALGVEWHRNFAERHDLPFTLLSDEGLR